jgi:hypothetical protein
VSVWGPILAYLAVLFAALRLVAIGRFCCKNLACEKQGRAGVQGTRFCHPLPVSNIAVDIEPVRKLPGLKVRARVKMTGRTGVEMEALTAVAVACLTIYDMVKAVERGMRIEGIRLLEKRGGKSGHYRVKGDYPVLDITGQPWQYPSIRRPPWQNASSPSRSIN